MNTPRWPPAGPKRTSARHQANTIRDRAARDQLYLALRLAAIERHLEHHGPLPTVFDDILVNFDDERATATLRLLADLSRRTQVLFLTHHAHLAELARNRIGDDVANFHRL